MKKISSLTIAFLILTNSSCLSQKPQLPNIVVFLIDDMGSQDLGCYGNTFYQTPNIDALAKKGVKFSNAYSSCTVCSPTRASLMTGKYPARLRITDWIQGHKKPYAMLNVPEWTMYLPLAEKTLAESLKEKGYATWLVGKWHLGDDEIYWPDNQGFDVNIAGNFKGSPVKNDQSNGYFSPYGLKRLTDGPKDEYLTDRLTDEAIHLIETQNTHQPFFLNLAHYAVHTPIQGKAEKVAKYTKLLNGEKNPQKNAEYAAMIESVDESVARIIQKLEEKKLLENTLIIFAADLSSQNSSKTEELKTLMYAWRKNVKAQMMTPNPEYTPAKANKGPERKSTER